MNTKQKRELTETLMASKGEYTLCCGTKLYEELTRVFYKWDKGRRKKK